MDSIISVTFPRRPPRLTPPRELPELRTRVSFPGIPAQTTGRVVARCFSVLTVDVELDDGRRYQDVSVDELKRY